MCCKEELQGKHQDFRSIQSRSVECEGKCLSLLKGGLQAQFVNLFTFIQEGANQVYYCSFLLCMIFSV